jgi:hypothetical protein
MHHFRFMAYLSLLIAVLWLSSCTKTQQEVDQLIQRFDPQLIGDVETFLYEHSIDVEEAAKRAPVIGRALLWVILGVPYSQERSRDGYRTDCSGFISYAWQFRDEKGRALSPNTTDLGNKYCADIPLENLQGGDIINNKKAHLGKGHVVLFVYWLGDDRTRFLAFEENGGEGRMKAVSTELTIETLVDGGFTIKEYEAYAPGPYYAQECLEDTTQGQE